MTTTTIRQAGDPLERASAFALAAAILGLIVWGAWPMMNERAAAAPPMAQPTAQPTTKPIILIATPALGALSEKSLQFAPTAAPAPTAPLAPTAAPPMPEPQAAPPEPPAPVQPQPAIAVEPPPAPVERANTQPQAVPHAQAHPGDPPGGAPGTAPRRVQP